MQHLAKISRLGAGRLLEAEAVIGEHLVGNAVAQLAALTARAASRYRRISPVVGAGLDAAHMQAGDRPVVE